MFQLKRHFSFGGQSSAEFGLYLSKEPEYPLGKRKTEVFDIPGRNGKLHIDQGCYEDITLNFDLLLQGDFTTGDQITEWLNQGKGKPMPLTVSCWPGITFLAIPETVGSLEYQLLNFHRAKLTFTCAPQKFLEAGMMPERYPLFPGQLTVQSVQITNPGTETAAPIFRIDTVSGRNIGEIWVSVFRNLDDGNTLESSIKIQDFSGYIVIDTETGHAYNDSGDMGTHVSYRAGEYAENPYSNLLLSPGVSEIRITRIDKDTSFDMDALTITGRWWHA